MEMEFLQGEFPPLVKGEFQLCKMEMKWNIFCLPWQKHRPIVLGPRFKEAFQDPNSYLYVEPIFEKEQYIVTYNPAKGNIYALFKDQAKSDDILKAAFHAHVLLHIIHPSNQNPSSGKPDHNISVSTDFESYISESYKMVSASYEPFKNKARDQGWVMSESLLNPGRARLCRPVR